jgi:hypothetical protein
MTGFAGLSTWTWTPWLTSSGAFDLGWGGYRLLGWRTPTPPKSDTNPIMPKTFPSGTACPSTEAAVGRMGKRFQVCGYVRA